MAIELLGDLRDLAERSGRADGVAERGGTAGGLAARVRQLRERHAKKPAFLQRLTKAGFTA
jgi:hypothetical protein